MGTYKIYWLEHFNTEEKCLSYFRIGICKENPDSMVARLEAGTPHLLDVVWIELETERDAKDIFEKVCLREMGYGCRFKHYRRGTWRENLTHDGRVLDGLNELVAAAEDSGFIPIQYDPSDKAGLPLLGYAKWAKKGTPLEPLDPDETITGRPRRRPKFRVINGGAKVGGSA